MTQQAIELILMRQLATHLAMPVFIVDVDGDLLFYNEAAEALLGHPYSENDEMPIESWSRLFHATGQDGHTMQPDEFPLTIAIREQRPAHLGPFHIRGLDDVHHKIAVTAFPLEGQQGRYVGAVAIFWEVD